MVEQSGHRFRRLHRAAPAESAPHSLSTNAAASRGWSSPSCAALFSKSALADGRVCGPERANLHGVLGRHLADSGDERRALRHVAEALAARGGETPEWLGFVTDPPRLDHHPVAGRRR